MSRVGGDGRNRATAAPPNDPVIGTGQAARGMEPKRRKRNIPTAHDVASRAGVSQSAVSRVYTQGASASAETRRKVLEAAEALGYRPNLLARSLITRRSGLVGVVIGYMDNQFYPAALQALSQALHAAGHRILLLMPGANENQEPVLEEVLRYRVDALVMAASHLSSRFAEQCRAAGLPVLLFNRTTEPGDASSVTGDNIAGARLVADFLVAGGHSRFAFVSGLRDSSTSRDREAGFCGRLQELGLPPILQAEGQYDFAGAQRAARLLLSQTHRPDAIFCANDHMALAVLDIARSEFNLAIGSELSIVGFDDISPAAWPGYSLTTYSQPLEIMVEAAMDILMRSLVSPVEETVHRVIPGRLVLRRSARRPTNGVIEVVDNCETWTSSAVAA